MLRDHYMTPEHRFRVEVDSKKPMVVTFKNGNKKNGRDEYESEVLPSSEDNFNKFIESAANLTVEKRRFTDTIFGDGVTIDQVTSPMNIGFIELEFDDIDILNGATDLADEFNIKLNIKNAWQYFKRKIAFAGPPSSGKTSVAKQISLIMNNRFGANSSDVVEYATSFIQKQQRIPTFDDQILIYMKQKEREEAIASTANFVFSDCPAWLSYVYGIRALSGMEPSSSTDFAIMSLYKRAIKSLSDYDMTFYMKIVDYVENGVRYHSRDLSEEIGNEITSFLKCHGRSYIAMTYNDIEDAVNSILYLNEKENVKAFFAALRCNI